MDEIGKRKKTKKPPVSKQSAPFKQKEQAVLEIVGDDYWDWLEGKYDELIINHAIGLQK